MVEEYPHTITFQSLQKEPDGGGGYTEGWVDFRTTEAFVDPISGKEFYQAQQLQTPINYNVYFPYQDGIKPDMQILYDGVPLSIHSKPIDQGGQGEILMLKCASQ